MAAERPPIPNLALSVEEACASLGCSWDWFAQHVAPELRWVRRGRRKMVAVVELERWLAENAELTLPEPALRPGVRGASAIERPCK